jgi:hypothetical protein
VTLPFSAIDVTSASVVFTEENPFNPTVDARGETTMQNYSLFATISGEYPDLEVNVSSAPPLSSDRALLLLTTGSSSLEILSPEGATRSIGTYIGRELLSRIAGSSNPDESTFFDRLDVSIGREVSRAGRETISIEYRIGRDSPWYIVVERDRNENYNAGFAWRLWFR